MWIVWFIWFFQLVKPLEGGPARKVAEQKPLENTSSVLYVGRIPHGFYEEEMEGAFFFLCFSDFRLFSSSVFIIYLFIWLFLGFFGQFGTVKRLRIARNKKVSGMFFFLA